jgi:hypothetical protein
MALTTDHASSRKRMTLCRHLELLMRACFCGQNGILLKVFNKENGILVSTEETAVLDPNT